MAQQVSALDEPTTSWQIAVLLLLGAAVGALGAVLVLPSWVPALSGSLAGSEPKAFWYLSRASAFVAFGVLWSSVVLGLMLSNRMARIWPGGPFAADVHQFASLLGLAFALFHALILLGDRYASFSLRQLVVPFATESYKPAWVGLGQIAFYVMFVVTFSVYLRHWFGYRVWRVIHYASFVLFSLSLAHGIMSGTDSSAELARLVYWASGGSVLCLTIYRVLISSVRRR